MDQHRLDECRQRLEALRTELQATLASGSEQTRPVAPDRAIGRLTRQDAMQSQQMALELERRNQQRLTQIDSALRRVEEGTYGYCVRCDEEISAARLGVRPEAPICIVCADNRARR
jgi:DnaK suppressor protein